jgi:transposase
MLDDSELTSLPPKVREMWAGMEARVAKVEAENKLLWELVRALRIARYGAASEQLTDAQLELLDAEPGVQPQEVQQEAQLPGEDKQAAETSLKRPKSPRGFNSLPAHLPREEVLIECEAKDCVCPCCQGQREILGYDETERLHRIPARYVVQVFKRQKRACRRCEEGGVATAPAPAFIISKGIASNELVVDVLLAKYELHQPLYRQELQMERDGGALINRSTLCEWMMECGFLLMAVSDEMRRGLLEGDYIQADETPIGVQSKAVKGRNHRGYLWQYGRPGGCVIFDYRNGRGRDGPKAMLKGFRGVLQTDGYAVYNQLDEPGLIHSACLAHARRKFKEASEVEPGNRSLLEILGTIAQLYQIESRARDEGLDSVQRAALRDEYSRPLMDKLKAMILALRQSVLPKSLAGKACDYTLSLWKKLEVYLDHGQVEIDNNPAERSIRPVAVGRKNWLHFGSKAAGPRIAAILSVVETCHRLDISVKDYLLDVLPQLANGMRSEVAALTPQAWSAARSAQR